MSAPCVMNRIGFKTNDSGFGLSCTLVREILAGPRDPGVWI
jgi:hypothetical protein